MSIVLLGDAEPCDPQRATVGNRIQMERRSNERKKWAEFHPFPPLYWTNGRKRRLHSLSIPMVYINKNTFFSQLLIFLGRV